MRERLILKDNLLQGEIEPTVFDCSNNYSKKYVFRDSVELVMIIIAHKMDHLFNKFQLLIKLKTLVPEQSASFTAKFTSNKLGVKSKIFKSNSGHPQVVSQGHFAPNCFDIKIMVEEDPANTFFALHDDTDLTDFEIRGYDGSVRMHRVVLAAASPVLRAMLSGPWKEASERRVDVPSTSRQTLQHLKDYLYLRTLPVTGLEELLQLACYYMLPDLEGCCVNEMTKDLTAEKACHLLQYSINHKMTKLLAQVLECVKDNTVDIQEITYQFNETLGKA